MVIATAFALVEFLLLSGLTAGSLSGPPWSHVALYAAVPLGLWAVAAPLIVRLARWAVPGAASPARVLGTHALAGAVVALLLSGVAMQLLRAAPPLVFSRTMQVQDLAIGRPGPGGEMPLHSDPQYEAVAERMRAGLAAVMAGGVPAAVSRTWLSSFLMFLTCYGLMAAVLSAMLYARHARDRDVRNAGLEAGLRAAQLKVLRSRLQPHFLFNTMNSIGVLMRHDVDGAQRTLGGLAGLLRRSLASMDRAESTVGEELRFVREYLDIERTRFGEALRIEVEAEPDVLEAAIPSFSLQPLVENAIRHGVGRRAALGRVAVRVRAEGDGVVAEVEDDGPGLAGGGERPALGVGLCNVDESLVRLHGPEAALQFGPHPAPGFRVAFRVPGRNGGLHRG